MNTRAKIFLAVSALVAASGCSKPKPVEVAPAPVADAAGCDVARAYVAGRLGRVANKASVVVDVAAANATSLAATPVATLTQKYDISQASPFGWTKDPPPAALIQAWLAAPHLSPFTACRDFNQVVTTAGVQMGAVQPGEKPAKGQPDRTQMNFSIPVVSADGNEALVVESGKGATASQVSILVHLRKDKDGAWKEADFLPEVS